MDLLPQGRNQNRLTALGLLVAVAGLVYLVLFHFTFVRPYAEAGERISQLETQLARYRSVSAQRDELTRQLQKVSAFQQNNDYFLSGSSVELAAAALAERLKQIVAANAGAANSCQVIATRTEATREPERFQRVSVNVRMRCDIEQFRTVLYELESGSPFVFINNVTIWQQCVRARGGGCQDRFLDVSFDMYGYLNQPSQNPRRV